MTLEDQVVGALCSWKEARDGGTKGMQSILNVLVNRATKNGTSVYEEALRPEQFSSMTTPGDRQLGIGPNALDAADWKAFMLALSLASQAATDSLPDITGGATLYYDPKVLAPGSTVPYTLPDGTVTVFPAHWRQAAVAYRCTIDGQFFFSE